MEEKDLIASNLLNNLNLNSLDVFSGYSLRPKEDYESSPVIKKAFTDESGKFNTDKWNNYYSMMNHTYNKLENKNFSNRILNSPEFLDMAPLDNPINRAIKFKNYTSTPAVVSKTIAPNIFDQTYGLIGIDKKSDRTESLSEVMQQQKVFDWDKKQFTNQTAEDLGFWGVLSDPVVPAIYREDTTDIDPITGEQRLFKKGEYKLNSNLKPYYETLGDRRSTNDELSAYNVIVRENSYFSDPFFESDGIEKSSLAVVAQTGAMLGLGLIGAFGTGKAAAAATALTAGAAALTLIPSTANVGATYFQAANDYFDPKNKVNNNLANKIKAVTSALTPSISEESQMDMWTLENMGKLTVSSLQQLNEQKAIFQIVTGIPQLFGINNSKLLNKVGASLASTYMIGVSAASMYDAAQKEGLSDDSKFYALLGSTAAYGLLSKTPLASSLFSKYSDESLSASKAITNATQLKVLGKTMKEAIDEAIPNAISLGKQYASGQLSKTELAQQTYKTFFSKTKEKLKPVFDKLDSPDFVKSYTYAMLTEGTEELTEALLAEDAIKYLHNAAVKEGFILPKTSKQFKLDASLDEYTLNFLGGAISGAVFRSQNKIKLDDSITRIVANGGMSSLLKQINTFEKQGFFGSTKLSAETDNNGSFIPTNDKSKTQNAIIANILRNHVTNTNDVINKELARVGKANIIDIISQYNVDEQDLNIIQSSGVKELITKNLIDAGNDTLVKRDIERNLDNIVKGQLKLKELQSKVDPNDIQTSVDAIQNETEQIKNVQKIIEDSRLELANIANGSKKEQYYNQALFSFRKDISQLFGVKSLADFGGNVTSYSKYKMSELYVEDVNKAYNLLRSYKDNLEDIKLNNENALKQKVDYDRELANLNSYNEEIDNYKKVVDNYLKLITDLENNPDYIEQIVDDENNVVDSVLNEDLDQVKVVLDSIKLKEGINPDVNYNDLKDELLEKVNSFEEQKLFEKSEKEKEIKNNFKELDSLLKYNVTDIKTPYKQLISKYDEDLEKEILESDSLKDMYYGQDIKTRLTNLKNTYKQLYGLLVSDLDISPIVKSLLKDNSLNISTDDFQDLKKELSNRQLKVYELLERAEENDKDRTKVRLRTAFNQGFNLTKDIFELLESKPDIKNKLLTFLNNVALYKDSNDLTVDYKNFKERFVDFADALYNLDENDKKEILNLIDYQDRINFPSQDGVYYPEFLKAAFKLKMSLFLPHYYNEISKNNVAPLFNQTLSIFMTTASLVESEGINITFIDGIPGSGKTNLISKISVNIYKSILDTPLDIFVGSNTNYNTVEKNEFTTLFTSDKDAYKINNVNDLLNLFGIDPSSEENLIRTTLDIKLPDLIIFDEATNISLYQLFHIYTVLKEYNDNNKGKNFSTKLLIIGDTEQIGFKDESLSLTNAYYQDPNYAYPTSSILNVIPKINMSFRSGVREINDAIRSVRKQLLNSLEGKSTKRITTVYSEKDGIIQGIKIVTKAIDLENEFRRFKNENPTKKVAYITDKNIVEQDVYNSLHDIQGKEYDFIFSDLNLSTNNNELSRYKAINTLFSRAKMGLIASNVPYVDSKKGETKEETRFLDPLLRKEIKDLELLSWSKYNTKVENLESETTSDEIDTNVIPPQVVEEESIPVIPTVIKLNSNTSEEDDTSEDVGNNEEIFQQVSEITPELLELQNRGEAVVLGEFEFKRADIERGRKEELNNLDGVKNTAKVIEGIENGDNKSFKELIKVLVNNFNLKNVATNFVTTLQSYFGVPAGGDYSRGVITINVNSNNNQQQTFIHEAIHSVTKTKLDLYNGGQKDKLSKKDVIAIENLYRIYEKVQKELVNLKSSRGTAIFKDLSPHYGFTNIDEFLSESFANPEFQRLLSNIKGEGKTPNLFKQFLDVLASLLGISNSTILNDIFAWTEQFATSPILTDDIAEINAKYDAELAALEQQTNSFNNPFETEQEFLDWLKAPNVNVELLKSANKNTETGKAFLKLAEIEPQRQWIKDNIDNFKGKPIYFTSENAEHAQTVNMLINGENVNIKSLENPIQSKIQRASLSAKRNNTPLPNDEPRPIKDYPIIKLDNYYEENVQEVIAFKQKLITSNNVKYYLELDNNVNNFGYVLGYGTLYDSNFRIKLIAVLDGEEHTIGTFLNPEVFPNTHVNSILEKLNDGKRLEISSKNVNIKEAIATTTPNIIPIQFDENDIQETLGLTNLKLGITFTGDAIVNGTFGNKVFNITLYPYYLSLEEISQVAEPSENSIQFTMTNETYIKLNEFLKENKLYNFPELSHGNTQNDKDFNNNVKNKMVLYLTTLKNQSVYKNLNDLIGEGKEFLITKNMRKGREIEDFQYTGHRVTNIVNPIEVNVKSVADSLKEDTLKNAISESFDNIQNDNTDLVEKADEVLTPEFLNWLESTPLEINPGQKLSLKEKLELIRDFINSNLNQKEIVKISKFLALNSNLRKAVLERQSLATMQPYNCKLI